MRKTIAVFLLAIALTGVAFAEDQKHPNDPCPKGTKEVTVEKRTEISGGVDKTYGSQTVSERSKVCRPDKDTSNNKAAGDKNKEKK